MMHHEGQQWSQEHRQLAAELYAHAQSLIDGGDQAEQFNAVVDFAQERSIPARSMGPVLTILHRQGHVSAALLRNWIRDGAPALGETRIVGVADALVNQDLQQHAARTSEWNYAAFAGELGDWFKILNEEFFGGKLPPAAISVDRERRNNLGWYRPGRDGLALRYRINLNSLYIAKCERS